MPDNPDNPNNPNNTQFLRAAAAVMSDLDIRYMEADFNGKVALKPELDKAMLAFSQLRLKLLKNAVLCKPTDIQKMQALRQDISKADGITTLLQVAVRVSSFLMKLA
jgi:hypothetical protein